MALQAANSTLTNACVPGRLQRACLTQAVPSAVRPALGFTRTPMRRSVITAAEKKSSSTMDTDKIVDDLKSRWEDVEDKKTFIAYSAGALAALWIASSVVNAFNGVPLLPKLFELVGLAYASWFVYRYLLFKTSRAELIDDIDELKKKITGGGGGSE